MDASLTEANGDEDDGKEGVKLFGWGRVLLWFVTFSSGISVVVTSMACVVVRECMGADGSTISTQSVPQKNTSLLLTISTSAASNNPTSAMATSLFSKFSPTYLPIASTNFKQTRLVLIG